MGACIIPPPPGRGYIGIFRSVFSGCSFNTPDDGCIDIFKFIFSGCSFNTPGHV